MPHLHRLTPLAAALMLFSMGAVQAQKARSVTSVPQPSAPASITPATPGPGLPSPSGLASPLPSPAGLPSPFPAGLASPSPFPAGLPPVADPTLSARSTAAPGPGSTGTMVTPPSDGTVFMAPIGTSPTPAVNSNGNVNRAAAANAITLDAAGGGTAGTQRVPSGAGPYTALQLAQSFQAADANRDGELTRAEFSRLTIAPVSFEDMDRNKDGVISRSEYEDASR